MKLQMINFMLVVFGAGGLAQAKSLPAKRVQTTTTEWVTVAQPVDDSVEAMEEIDAEVGEGGAVVVYEGEQVPVDDDQYEYIEVEARKVAVQDEPEDDEGWEMVEEDVAYPIGSTPPMRRVRKQKAPIKVVADRNGEVPMIQVIYQSEPPAPKKRWVRRKRQPAVVEQAEEVQSQGFQGDTYNFYFNSRRK